MTNIWVEKLGLAGLLRLFLCGLKANTYIYYDEHKVTPLAARALSFMRKCGVKARLYPAPLSLARKDAQGYAINYQMEDNLSCCLEAFIQKHASFEPEWFKRMLGSYISSFIFSRVTFITMVEHAPEFSASGRKNIFYLAKSPFGPIVKDFYRHKGYSIKEPVLSLMFLKYYLRPIYLLLKIAVLRFGLKKPRHNLKHIRPSVWIEYGHEQIIDFSFWHPMLDKEKFDLVYYLDRSDDPAVDIASSVIEKRGFKWADLHFSALVRLANLRFADIRGLWNILFAGSFGKPAWSSALKFEYRMWFLLFRDVFSKFKVKVLIQHQEFSWIQQAQADAVEANGGIMLGFHWSNFPYAREPFHLTPEHAYFVWGKVKLEWVRKKGNTCRYILPSGLWALPNGRPDQALEQFMPEHKFVLAIFDSTATYDIYQSPDDLSNFYALVLGLIEENRDWIGLIKSKNLGLNRFLSLPRGEAIVSQIKALSDQGKIIFLKRTTLPAEASAKADLSVCFGMNSAGIMAGMCGCRAVHWDCSGWRRYPFYSEMKQKILFENLDGLKDAIIKVSAGDKEIGDFSKWRREFNCFEDFSAKERVGDFIQSFMTKATNGCAQTALDAAAEEYLIKNNVASDFFAASDWYNNG